MMMLEDLIAFAKKLNIEIMPEIDLPAHSWALIASHARVI